MMFLVIKLLQRVESNNFMTKLLALLLLFGVIGCGGMYSNIKDKDIVFSCSCIESKSTSNMCTHQSDITLIINEEAGILSFNNSVNGSLEVSQTKYSAGNDSNSYSLNRASLEITHKWGRHINGGPVIDVYKCAKPSI